MMNILKKYEKLLKTFEKIVFFFLRNFVFVVNVKKL